MKVLDGKHNRFLYKIWSKNIRLYEWDEKIVFLLIEIKAGLKETTKFL